MGTLLLLAPGVDCYVRLLDQRCQVIWKSKDLLIEMHRKGTQSTANLTKMMMPTEVDFSQNFAHAEIIYWHF